MVMAACYPIAEQRGDGVWGQRRSREQGGVEREMKVGGRTCEN